MEAQVSKQTEIKELMLSKDKALETLQQKLDAVEVMSVTHLISCCALTEQ